MLIRVQSQRSDEPECLDMKSPLHRSNSEGTDSIKCDWIQSFRMPNSAFSCGWLQHIRVQGITYIFYLVMNEIRALALHQAEEKLSNWMAQLEIRRIIDHSKIWITWLQWSSQKNPCVALPQQGYGGNRHSNNLENQNRWSLSNTVPWLKLHDWQFTPPSTITNVAFTQLDIFPMDRKKISLWW